MLTKLVVKRDLRERGRDLEGVLHQYIKFVKPSFDEYILPVSKSNMHLSITNRLPSANDCHLFLAVFSSFDFDHFFFRARKMLT